MTQEERKAYNKKWRENNAEKMRETQIRWVQKNKEKVKEYQREYQRRYRQEHSKEEEYHQVKNEYQRRYRQEHPECDAKYRKVYKSTKKGRATILARGYKRNDKLKEWDTDHNISPEWIVENIFNGQKCIYCGESDWKLLGVDRIDNSKPHTPDNCVCSCWPCNNRRGNKYTFDEFKEKMTERR